MKIDGDCHNFPDKVILINQVNELLGTPLEDLLVLLGVDLESYFGKTFCIKAFGRLTGPSTSFYLQKNKETGHHLIWLPKNICEGSDPNFVWEYAHECGHRLQDAKWPKYHDWEKSLLRLNDKLLNYDIPSEMDAHITAKRIVFNMFGEEALSACISDKIKAGHEPSYWGYIKILNYDNNLDLEKECLQRLALESSIKYPTKDNAFTFLSGLFPDKSKEEIERSLAVYFE